MTNNIDRAAEVLYNEHVGCKDVRYYLIHCLADEGLITPDLPALHGESWAALDGHGHVRTRGGVDDILLTPAEAREVAYDLLAAANHAEKEMDE